MGGVPAVLSLIAGAVFAAAPSFSGLALLAVLLIGALVALPLFTAAYPPDGWLRPADTVLRWWLVWTAVVAIVEGMVLLAGDDLRWPTVSALQDPLTAELPAGRFVAGAIWTAAGCGLVVVARRYRGAAPASLLGRATAAVAAIGLLVLAVRSLGDGPLLQSRSGAPSQRAAVDTVPAAEWPLTAWLMLAVVVGLALAMLALHVWGRRTDPPAGLSDVLAWAMAPWSGRVLGFAIWLWCGWHFLAR